MKWCPGEDSNLHGFHHWYLKPARLPIPPPGQRGRHKGGGFGLSMTGGIRLSRHARPQPFEERRRFARLCAGIHVLSVGWVEPFARPNIGDIGGACVTLGLAKTLDPTYSLAP